MHCIIPQRNSDSESTVCKHSGKILKIRLFNSRKFIIYIYICIEDTQLKRTANTCNIFRKNLDLDYIMLESSMKYS